MRSGNRSSGGGPAAAGLIPLDNPEPLVVPVLSAAGGVGRSTVAAVLAAALKLCTSDQSRRAVGVCDVSPRSASPWPGWVDHTAEHGTGWLAACTADADLYAQEVRRSTSAMDTEDGVPIWVLADTGLLHPAFSRAHPGPRFWAPALRYLRAAVIDGDQLEAFRLVRQLAGGKPSVTADWMASPAARTAALWVTDPSPAGLARTMEAVTAAEQCGLPMRQFVVVVNDHSGHGWSPRSRSRRTLLADRVGAIVELGHDAALRRDGRPSCSPRHLDRRDVADLVTAVIAAAGRPRAVAEPPLPAAAAVWPAAARLPLLAAAERISRHVATPAPAVPAGR